MVRSKRSIKARAARVLKCYLVEACGLSYYVAAFNRSEAKARCFMDALEADYNSGPIFRTLRYKSMGPCLGGMCGDCGRNKED